MGGGQVVVERLLHAAWHQAVAHEIAAGGRFRLGPVTRLFELPAPEQSLKVQIGGQQCGSEIDKRGNRPRP
jgi:hypothetical protein